MDRSRYSDADLEEFREVINKKLERHHRQLAQVQEQLREMSEAGDDDYSSDWLDNSSVNTELDMLTTMAERQIKYIHALDEAMVRIQHKTYGICAVTGKLIDKKRLLAVPTTTKSIEGKAIESARPSQSKSTDDREGQDGDEAPRVKKTPPPSKVTTRVIRKRAPSDGGKSAESDDSDSWLDQLTGSEVFQPDESDMDMDEENGIDTLSEERLEDVADDRDDDDRD